MTNRGAPLPREFDDGGSDPRIPTRRRSERLLRRLPGGRARHRNRTTSFRAVRLIGAGEAVTKRGECTLCGGVRYVIAARQEVA